MAKIHPSVPVEMKYTLKQVAREMHIAEAVLIRRALQQYLLAMITQKGYAQDRRDDDWLWAKI